MINDAQFENEARISYGDGMWFVRRCEQCGSFVKKPESVLANDYGLSPEPHTECWRCGPTRMIFEGYF